MSTTKVDKRLVGIDALRGIAAIVIVCFHARSMFWIGLGETWRRYGLTLDINALAGYATAPLYLGGLAVELFFVISGYSIHRRGAHKLAKSPNTELATSSFLSRRFWRIYPVYFIALCVTACVDIYTRAYYGALVPSSQTDSVLSFFTSLLSLQGLAAPIFGSNTVFWTLALEMHFYLLYPVLYFLSRRFGPFFVLSLTFVTNVIYIVTDSFANLSRLLPYMGSGIPIFVAYWFLWGTGFYIAEIEAGRARRPKHVYIIGIMGAVLTTVFATLKIWSFASLCAALAFGSVIYWTTTSTGKNFWSNSWGKSLAVIGLFSYSIYAIHRPTLLLMRTMLAPNGAVYSNLAPTFLAVVVAISMGGLLFVLVERWTLVKDKPTEFNLQPKPTAAESSEFI